MRTRSISRAVQQNQLKRQCDTLEEFQLRPSSRARTKREILVASKTDPIEKSRLSVAGQTPHSATTGQEKSPDGDREGPRTAKDVSAQALECEAMEREIRSLNESLDNSQKESNVLYEERVEILDATSHDGPSDCEIRLLERKLDDAQKQIDQEIKKYHKLEGRLKIAESQNETISCEIKLLKEKLEATQKDLEEERKFAADLMIENDSKAHENLSLQERLETAKEQNIRSCQGMQELHEKQPISESKIKSLTEELEGATHGSHQIQNIREIQTRKPENFRFLIGALESSAMDCRCGRCILGLPCNKLPKTTTRVISSDISMSSSDSTVSL